MLGKILGGRYQIISHLAGGGFGTTFVAEDRHLPGNPQCIVKQLQPKNDLWALQAARRLFNKEAEVLSQLGNHPHIPRLFAHFEEDQDFYLVQEFIEGHELREELPVGQQWSEAEVIALLREILEILTFVHQQDVIHRDIKPSNLIRRQQDGKLFLIDFGAVKQITTPVINSQGHTSFTIAIGSPGYMPNEQLAGKPRFCSDIYAIGIIGIQALTGLNPKQLPEDPRTSEIIWRDAVGTTQSEQRVQVSPELADVLDKMVRYDFRQRYQSAVEVLEALNSVSPTPYGSTSTIPITPQKPKINLPITDINASDHLSSEREVDYTRLRDLLAAGKWKEADQETNTLMLKVAEREQENFLRAKDIAVFPCQDLQTINSLWVKYSKGRFGFSVQKDIWETIGASPNTNLVITECKFADRLGWRVKERRLDYDELTFSLCAVQGYLPRLCLGEIGRLLWSTGMDAPRMSLGDLFSRMEACKLHESIHDLPKLQPEIPTNDFISDRGIDYTRLRDLLASEKWKEADLETEAIMLKVCGQERAGWLRVEDIETFPAQDLRTINQLWVDYSNGRFGFSVQKSICEEVTGKLDVDEETWCRFAERVGWRVNGDWIVYHNLTFGKHDPLGHLPASCFVVGSWWWCGYEYGFRLLSRAEGC